MIRKYSIIILLIGQMLLVLLIMGCADSEDLFEIADGSEFITDISNAEAAGEINAETSGATADTANAENSGATTGKTNIESGAATSDISSINQEAISEPTIVVYVCGHVKRSGVYELPVNSRVYEAVNAAGGLLPDAAQDLINQAEIIYDGQKLYIPSKKEMTSEVNGGNCTSNNTSIQILSGGTQNGIYNSNNPTNNTMQNINSNGNSLAGQAAMMRININTASAQELTAIPGIGSTKAAAIVSYRDNGGKFVKLEDITNVSGIGPSTYEKIKDYITLN